ncbi:MAG: hypothetical protein ACFBZ8_10270 [Opitutales bacterium]
MHFRAPIRSRHAVWVAACLVAFLAACQPSPDPEGVAFAEAYLEAINHGDLEGLLALYHAEGVPDSQIEVLRRNLAFEIEEPVYASQFIPLNEEGVAEALERSRPLDKTLVPNLEPQGLLKVFVDVPEHRQSSFLLGKNEQDLWRILMFVKSTASAPAD